MFDVDILSKQALSLHEGKHYVTEFVNGEGVSNTLSKFKWDGGSSLSSSS